MIDMKNSDFRENKFKIADPIESYFECILTCDIKDRNCISRCVDILKDYES